ncbi:hypothetical protein [Legionella sp. WA2022007384]
MESSVEIKDIIKPKNTNRPIIILEPEYAAYFEGYPGAYGFDAEILEKHASGEYIGSNNLEDALYNTKAIITELANGRVKIAFATEEDSTELQKVLAEVPPTLWSLTFEPRQLEKSLSQGPNIFEEQKKKYEVQQERIQAEEETQSKLN